MYFLDNILSKKTKSLRQALIVHPLWEKIANGTLEKKRLQTFALQDYWLIKHARRIDALAIAKVEDKQLQHLLITRLKASAQRHSGKRSASRILKGSWASQDDKNSFSIFDFGKGLGLTKKDFENAIPIAGCMALTTFFYWIIDYTESDFEKVAAIFASIGVFSDICMQIYKPLIKHYKLSEKQVGFFTAHKHSEDKVNPISLYIEKHCQTKEKRESVDHAVYLSYSFEKLFYDTVLRA